MSQEIKNVVLTGASGNLGPSILSAFLASSNPTFNITVLSRTTSSATFPPSVRVIKIDYSYDSLVSAFQGQDAVVSLAGGDRIEEQKVHVDAAVAAGVKRFIPSDFGSDTTNPVLLGVIPFFGIKRGVVEYLKSKESETFSWSSIVTGAFFDWGMKVGFIDIDTTNKKAKLWDDGSARFSVSNLALIGRAVVAVLSPDHVAETRNEDVFIQSFAVSQVEVIAMLEKLQGQKYEITETIDSRALQKEKLEAWGKGERHGGVIYPLIKAALLGTGSGNAGDHGAKSWNTKLGLPESEDLEESVKAVLAA